MIFKPLHAINVQEYELWAEQNFKYLAIQNQGDNLPLSICHPVIRLRLANLLAQQAAKDLAESAVAIES